MFRIPVAALSVCMVAAFTISACAQDFRARRAASSDELVEVRLRRGASAPVEGLETVALNSGGVERTYLVHVPPQLAGQSGLPAVLVFHGGQGDGNIAASASGMMATADQMGFVAIFPNSAGSQWNDGRDTTRSEVDDVAFVREVIASASGLYGVDSRSVFAAGISNGGIFTQRLACDAADAFDAMAVVAANMPADLVGRCAPSRPLPMIFFNGTDDRMMPNRGGEVKAIRALGLGAGGTVISRDDTQAFWAQENGCAQPDASQPLPDQANDGTTVQVQAYAQCAGSTALKFYVIDGGGHNWPGSSVPETRFGGTISRDISATSEIARFFAGYGL